MKVKQYREVDFSTALYEQTHKGAVVEFQDSHGQWYTHVKFYECVGALSPDKWFGTKYRIVTEVDDPYAELKEAHAAGKVIQYKSSSGVWSDVAPSWCVEPARYRIKPEPKYRPWRTVDEVPVGKVVRNTKNKCRLLINYACTDGSGLSIGCGGITLSAVDLFLDRTMDDGSPCGVLEDAQ